MRPNGFRRALPSAARSFLPLLLLAGLSSTTRSANADPNNPTDSDKAAARPFAMEGLRLAQSGNCRDAIEKLTRSEALVHAPTVAVPLAQCQIQLGKIIAGTELLNRVLNEALPPGAPPSWAEAKQQAAGILAAAQPRIAKLRIHVDVPPGVTPNPEVSVDGQVVNSVLLDNDRPTDPGPHHVVARQTGVGSAETDVTVAEGQVRAVSLRLDAQTPGLGAAGAVPGAPSMAAGTGVAVGAPEPFGAPPPAASAKPPPPGLVAPYVPGGSTPPASTPDGEHWMAVEFGARLAGGIPLGSGDGANGNDLNHSVSSQVIPLWLDAGFRFASHWYAGGYFSYGVASVSDQFDGGACKAAGYGCSSNDIRLGVDAQYHVLPDGKVDPWVGVGFGYEWLSGTETLDAAHTVSGQAITRNFGSSGWELFNAQTGVDFRLLDGALGIGPFLSVAFTQYSEASVSTDNVGGTTGQSIQNQALHEWVLFGARGDFDLKLR